MKRLLRFGSGTQLYEFPDNGISYTDNFGDLVPRTTRLPGLSGGFDELGDTPAPSEIGNIAYTFWLFADNKPDMDRQRDAVREMVSFGWKRLYLQPEDPDATERYCTARINSIQMTENTHNRHDRYQRVTVNFQVSDPHWYTAGTEAWNWGSGAIWGGASWGGTATPNACSGTSTEFTITTRGNAVTLPRITVSCAAGQTAHNVKIQRLVEGVIAEEIEYKGTLDDTTGNLVINCRASSVRLASTSVYGSFEFNHPDWFRLFPDGNTIKVLMGQAGDACSVTFRYYEVYV